MLHLLLAALQPSHKEVKAVLHMNQTEAAKVLGISDAKLRTLQRAMGLKRWPGRKLNSVMNHKKVQFIHPCLSCCIKYLVGLLPLRGALQCGSSGLCKSVHTVRS